MNLLTKLLVLVGVGCLGAWGYFNFQSNAEKEIITEKRYLSLLTNSLSDPSGTIDNLDELLGSSKITNNELLLLTELILDSPEKSIDPYLPKLSEKLNDPSVDWQVLSAVVQYHEGRIAETLTKLQKVAEENPANRRVSYEYNRARMSAGSVEERIAAKLKLFDLAKSDDRWAYKSLRVLAYSSPMRGLTQRDVRRASKELRTHALVQPADFLTASGILLSMQESNQIEAFLQETQQLGKDLVSVDELGSWFGRIGRPDLALQVVSTQKAFADDPAFFARFQALLETNQTEQADQLLGQATHLSEPRLLLAQTYLKISQGEPGALARFFEEAKELNTVSSLLDVARLALLQGNGDVSLQAFQAAWSIDPASFNLSQSNQFLQMSLKLRKTQDAQKITAEIKRKNSQKFGNANNHVYLSLLLGEDPAVLANEAQRIVDAFPGNPSFLSTLALSKLLLDQPGEALEVMKQRGRTPLIHGERALLACILMADGKKEDAQELSKGLEENRMLPEEWALAQRYGLVAKGD
jgi:hypothetical protein